MELPEDFKKRMEELLGNEYKSFILSYKDKKQSGLRVNTLKLNVQDLGCLPFKLESIPWAYEGFYYNEEERPGRHLLHEAGVYYIQEPSAMSVVSLLAPEEGDLVCDLCAAPGGKSTHIAERLKGTGLLVSNEISQARAKILSQNIERLGIYNAIVCNEPPDRMACRFPGFFDKILVDAPCSGEGMFRKDNKAIEEWSTANSVMCARRQKAILECAGRMLKPGGEIVYSTCTFAPCEDEDILIWFLREHKEYKIQDWKSSSLAGYIRERGYKSNIPESGRKDFISESLGNISQEEREAAEGSLRLWPHKTRGEGHFAFKLKKEKACSTKNGVYINKNNIQKSKKSTDKSFRPVSKKELAVLKEFLEEIFITDMAGFNSYSKHLIFWNDMVYLMPDGINSISGLKVLRPGLNITVHKKNRFEPAHALAKAIKPELARQCMECNGIQALKYIHGETIKCKEEFQGWILVAYNGFPLGWGKAMEGIVKNHYPKGLRV